MDIADRLVAARQHAKLTQAQLAEAIGRKQQTVQKLEGRKAKGSQYIVDMAIACGVSAYWLANGQGEMLESLAPSQGPSQPERFDADTMDAAIEFLQMVSAATNDPAIAEITWGHILTARKVLQRFGDDIEANTVAIIRELSAALREGRDGD